MQRTSEKQRWWENIDTLQRGTDSGRVITTHHCLRQSAQYFRSHRGLVPGTCSSSRSSCSTKHGDTCCESGNDQASQVPSEDVSRLTQRPPWSPRARGNLARQHEEKFENLPEDLQQQKSATTLFFFFENCLSRTFLQCHSPMAPQAHVKNFRILEVTKDPSRKDLFEATPKLVRYWMSWSQTC